MRFTENFSSRCRATNDALQTLQKKEKQRPWAGFDVPFQKRRRKGTNYINHRGFAAKHIISFLFTFRFTLKRMLRCLLKSNRGFCETNSNKLKSYHQYIKIKFKINFTIAFINPTLPKRSGEHDAHQSPDQSRRISVDFNFESTTAPPHLLLLRLKFMQISHQRS